MIYRCILLLHVGLGVFQLRGTNDPDQLAQFM